jgi:hypothetical protein
MPCTKEYAKEYYAKRSQEDVHCEVCNGHYKIMFKRAHEKTKKHLKIVGFLDKHEAEKDDKEKEELKNKIKDLEDKLSTMRAFFKANV